MNHVKHSNAFQMAKNSETEMNYIRRPNRQRFREYSFGVCSTVYEFRFYTNESIQNYQGYCRTTSACSSMAFANLIISLCVWVWVSECAKSGENTKSVKCSLFYSSSWYDNQALMEYALVCADWVAITNCLLIMFWMVFSTIIFWITFYFSCKSITV